MRAIIFDLDNTLYDVEQYFLGAFKNISEHISNKHKVDRKKIYDELLKIRKKKNSMYPRMFNDVLSVFGLEKEVKKIVNMFNDYECVLKPYPDVIPTLGELKKRGYKLGIITDGKVGRQKRKLKTLGIVDFFDVIIFTDEIGKPKSSELPFYEVVRKLGVKPEESAYVGDNPMLDFIGPKKIGMMTIRVRTGEFSKMEFNKYIDTEIKKIEELLLLFPRR